MKTLKDPEGVQKFKDNIIGFVNGISTVINAIMRTIEFISFGTAFKGDVEDYLIKPIQTQIGGAPSNMQDVVINSSGQQVSGASISSPFGPRPTRQEVTVKVEGAVEGQHLRFLGVEPADGANGGTEPLATRVG